MLHRAERKSKRSARQQRYLQNKVAKETEAERCIAELCWFLIVSHCASSDCLYWHRDARKSKESENKQVWNQKNPEYMRERGCQQREKEREKAILSIPGCGVVKDVFAGTEPSHQSTFPLELQFHQGASVQELEVDDKPLMAVISTNTEVCRELFQVISHK